MTYGEFKSYILDMMWRTGDTVIESRIDSLIRGANAELDRRLLVEDRHKQITLYAEELRIDLPVDYFSMRSLAFEVEPLPPLGYVPPADMFAIIKASGLTHWRPFYSIIDRSLLICGPVLNSYRHISDTPPVAPNNGDLWYRTTTNPGLYVWFDDGNSTQWVQLSGATAVDEQQAADPTTLILDYTSQVPDYQAADASWLEDRYFDLYVAAVMKHAAIFTREDERLPVLTAQFEAALTSANEHSAFSKTRGISASKPPIRQAGVNRRRARYGH